MIFYDIHCNLRSFLSMDFFLFIYADLVVGVSSTSWLYVDRWVTNGRTPTWPRHWAITYNHNTGTVPPNEAPDFWRLRNYKWLETAEGRQGFRPHPYSPYFPRLSLLADFEMYINLLFDVSQTIFGSCVLDSHPFEMCYSYLKCFDRFEHLNLKISCENCESGSLPQSTTTAKAIASLFIF